MSIQSPFIPGARVAFTNPDGTLSRAGYLFLQNLINLANPASGITVDDLATQLLFESDNTSQIAEIQKEIENIDITEAADPFTTTGTVRYVNATAPNGILGVSGVPYQNNGVVTFAWSGTSGGVPYFSSTTGMASSALLTSNAVVIGGGAGAAPSTSTITYVSAGGLDYPAITKPATPATDHARFYATTSNGHVQFNALDDDGTELIVTQDNTLLVRNTSGGAMTKGQAVNTYGATGQIPNVQLADASNAAKHAEGIMMEDVANNGFGLMMTLGIVSNINTSAFIDGDILYLSAATPGALTATAPSLGAAAFVQRIGVVAYSHATQGEIQVLLQGFKTLVNLATDVTGTLTVPNGGTGLSTATSYAVLCGGTTGTGAFQSIASVGTSGQALISNGAGALPTFQDIVATTVPSYVFAFSAAHG